MSRNLKSIACDICGGKVVIIGPKFDRSSHRWVVEGADADCSVCGTHYFAWIGPVRGPGMDGRIWNDWDLREKGFYALSYRSSFNDEPGDSDVPPGRVQVFRVVYRDGVEIGREEIE